MVGEKPLITYMLMSYNQENFIREAVESAFAQTYSPLEILLTDDASADRTFEIISEMAEAYRGPHRIVLNKNAANMGIGAHVNRAMELASGELVVCAAGDDASMPHRTTRIYEKWNSLGRPVCSIYSNGEVIDENGTFTGMLKSRVPTPPASCEDAVKRGGVGVSGCSHAFSRKVFEVFGPMDEKVVTEDVVIPFRSLLLGRIHYLDESLIRYRKHGNNISITAGGPTVTSRCREKMSHEGVLLTWIHDLRKAAAVGLLPVTVVEPLLTELYLQLRWITVERQFYQKSFLSGLFYLGRQVFGNSPLNSAIKIVERRLRSSRK
jgi:glycosyltransferase involved in cell wall biosynthesis